MNSAVKTYLKDALQNELPGAEAHIRMLPPGRRLKSHGHELSSVKLSSVLVLIFPMDGKLYTCLTKRPSTMKFHAGQISFPGGKVEKEDASAEMAALRESREEVGIDTSAIEVLGKLSDFYLEISGFSVQPFLAWTDKKPEFRLNSDEVEELILFPLTDFAENEIIHETELQTLTGLLRVKYYPFEGKIIWGATAMILSELIEILKKENQKSMIQE
ncbi:MAG: CoA pyrophosphatase [Bacteroidota bacterium]|nr:CoA pyrophosphatase [Odoribacter sp.]MDP3643395.1 CoA pyrophosphatase [Bacteroidota bacterium]